jgi:hypothetical protein
MMHSNDKEIRLALHEKRLRAYREAPDTIVVDELGLSHARVRIDIAVINGCVHGYEIKSSQDTLDRLPTQLALYGQCLERLTLVCAPRHTDRIEKIVPQWCGILEAKKGKRGGMRFSTVRRPRANPEIDVIQLAHLLWRPEAAELLARHGASRKVQNKSRKELYESLAELMNVRELTVAIREFMKSRRAWRDLQAHA